MSIKEFLENYITDICAYGSPRYDDDRLLRLLSLAREMQSSTLFKVLEKYSAALKADSQSEAVSYFAMLHMYL